MKSLSDLDEQHPEFRERRPDPSQPPIPPSPGVARIETSIARLGVVAGGILIAALIASVIMLPRVVRQSKDRHSQALLNMLVAASRHAVSRGEVLPPGNGSGTADLVRMLVSPAPGRPPLLILDPSQEDAGGNLVDGEGRSFRYRNPGPRSPDLFEIWTGDSSGRPDGINNWDP